MKQSEFWVLYTVAAMAPHLGNFGIGMGVAGAAAFLWYLSKGE
ncbi:hypothetical protein [Cupriavidus taiwanensis]|nr:hypothetical protein [Cupriavidus taiwanensis]